MHCLRIYCNRPVLKRNRQFDLLKVLAVYPHLLGIGIDEGTALLVTEERADVIGRSYVAVYNSTEWLATVDAGSEEQEHDPFFLLGDGQALDLVTRLPVGGKNAGQIEEDLMRAILSDRQLVVALRQRGAQQLLVHLQMVSNCLTVSTSRSAETLLLTFTWFCRAIALFDCATWPGSTRSHQHVQSVGRGDDLHPNAVCSSRTIACRPPSSRNVVDLGVIRSAPCRHRSKVH